MQLRSLALCLIFFFPVVLHAAPALEDCRLISETCLKTGTKTIDGFEVHRDCWKWHRKWNCKNPVTPVNYCATISRTSGCSELISRCVNERLGVCLEYEKTYDCTHRLITTGGAIYLNSTHTITRDALTDSCTDAQKRGCTRIKNTCVEGAETRNINGKDIYKDCWRWDDAWVCAGGDTSDTCGVLAAHPDCQQQSETCTQSDESVCLQNKFTYICESQPSNAGGAVLTDTDHTITKDEITNDCAGLEDCHLESETCVEVGGTRVIDGLSVTKDCWAWEQHYQCGGDTLNSDCDEFADCDYEKRTCVTTNDAGECTHWEKEFTCSTEGAGSPDNNSLVDCGSVNWCVSGNCEREERQANQAFPKAVVAMNAALEIGNDFDGVTVFAGTWRTCKKQIAGVKNCCKGSGWGIELGLASCSEDSKMLAGKRQAGQAHYVRSWCSKKIKIIGTCLEKKQAWCSFNSRLGRIIQEGARDQLGIEWDTGCRGLTPEELERLDYSQINLEEALGDIYDRMTPVEQDNALHLLETGIENLYSNSDEGDDE